MPQIKSKIAEKEVLPFFNGKTTEITLPSKRVVKVRETNGEDDELLSSLNSSNDGSNTYNFLSSIIVGDKNKPTPRDIAKWPINDKYGLLFKQRIFNHGSILKFSATCTECKHEDIYTEDLDQWDTDLSLDQEPKSNRALSLYPMGDKLSVEFVISSGKKLKYDILTGELEKAALELKDATKNSPLIIRRLSVENKGEWMIVKHFAGFSSKEMSEIRSNIKLNDKQFDPLVSFTCANPMCKKEYVLSLFAIGAFFFPEEMI